MKVSKFFEVTLTHDEICQAIVAFIENSLLDDDANFLAHNVRLTEGIGASPVVVSAIAKSASPSPVPKPDHLFQGPGETEPTS